MFQTLNVFNSGFGLYRIQITVFFTITADPAMLINHLGVVSVAYCATVLNLSASYFGDMIKREAGKTAQEYIQSKVIDVAKERTFDPAKSISEIAYEMGFKYPQHFTRLFKQWVGQSPSEYRMLNQRVGDCSSFPSVEISSGQKKG